MTFQYYASHPGTTNPNEERVKYLLENDIHLMISAAHWGTPFTAYAVDNGAWTDYNKKQNFNHERFLKVLKKIDKQERKPDFIVLPDIVKGGVKSLELSKSYLNITTDYPCYFAIQDGMKPDMITSDIMKNVRGFFIGGSDVWKWRNIHTWVNLAHENNKKIHVGRVGTLKDFLKCKAAGVDSADGSALIRNHQHYKIGAYLKIFNEQEKICEV